MPENYSQPGVIQKMIEGKLVNTAGEAQEPAEIQELPPAPAEPEEPTEPEV